MKLLLVEDDINLAEVLAEALKHYGYAIDIVDDGELAWEQAISEDYSTILMDVELPKLDGISLCQRLRSHGSTVPILMMTGRDANTDKVIGLDAGADDYIVKPVDLLELMARIRALMRRGTVCAESNLVWNNLVLEPSSHEVTYNGQVLELTPKEFSLLELFLRSGKRVLSRQAIINNIWASEEPPSQEAVKAHIKYLRQKLKMAGAPQDIIETIRGVGYRLKSKD
ncbi:two component transcriptional regulator, winged helix family [Stanieria cyanosphaera PCC 7437]|uniref:Two component transcriptional regulator, winged helix family n=1 Tax=Stanieria cyanosphaera (strain ATCC 29371 / PCC 7437) TaxID=111780 RepID=K9XSE8_STAC7|nr:response regulator transcription factor [Stanieria cyanosphaera]AFZ35525.1 two component transcriptional regulator, winged helix family [Stanieria cyanosphaera PCC 7437]